MRKALSFFIGAVLGGIIGAAAALLFAPFAGTELRGRISTRVTGLADELRNAANTKRIELQERLDTLRAPRK